MNDENENKRDAGTVFADFCDDLAMNFPLIKLQELKICLKGMFVFISVYILLTSSNVSFA